MPALSFCGILMYAPVQVTKTAVDHPFMLPALGAAAGGLGYGLMGSDDEDERGRPRSSFLRRALQGGLLGGMVSAAPGLYNTLNAPKNLTRGQLSGADQDPGFFRSLVTSIMGEGATRTRDSVTNTATNVGRQAKDSLNAVVNRLSGATAPAFAEVPPEATEATGPLWRPAAPNYGHLNRLTPPGLASYAALDYLGKNRAPVAYQALKTLGAYTNYQNNLAFADQPPITRPHSILLGDGSLLPQQPALSGATPRPLTPIQAHAHALQPATD